MRRTGFEPPVDCPMCRRIADAGEFGRCHGCQQAEHKCELQAFAVHLHGFAANWAAEPTHHALQLLRAGVINEEEFGKLRDSCGQLWKAAEVVGEIVGQAIGTDIAQDAYASGYRFDINGNCAND